MNFAKENIIAGLTSKNDKYTCAFADRIIAENREFDEWYDYFEAFASLLDHPKSLIRNRALHILAANAQWDKENLFDAVLPAYLSHITDENLITARQCIQSLAEIGAAKPQYIPKILSALQNVDLTTYRDSMRPLIEKDTAETTAALQSSRHAMKGAYMS